MSKPMAALLVVFFLAVLIGGWRIWSLETDLAKARLALAEDRQNAALALAEAQAKTIEADRRYNQIRQEMEAIYNAWDQDRATRGAEIESLEVRLSDTLERLRQSDTGNNTTCNMPSSAANASDCTQLRAANAKLTRALDRLVKGGGAIAADGQRAANIAGTAAEWGRKIGAE